MLLHNEDNIESWKGGGGEGGGRGGRGGRGREGREGGKGEGGEGGGRERGEGGKKIHFFLFLSGTLYCSQASLHISGETRKIDLSSLYAS